MVIERSLDHILNSKSKIAILRLFISKTTDFKANGREIAKLIHISAPAAHTALKELYSYNILKLDIIGKNHIYTLDSDNRIVRQILSPMFKKEITIKDEMKEFLIKQVKKAGISNKITSLILYGSLQEGTANNKSDVDIAVIIKNDKNKKEIEERFLNDISVKFSSYFNMHLDAYVKTKDEFCLRLKKNLPPVSTLMKSYSVILGKEPLDI